MKKEKRNEKRRKKQQTKENKKRKKKRNKNKPRRKTKKGHTPTSRPTRPATWSFLFSIWSRMICSSRPTASDSALAFRWHSSVLNSSQPAANFRGRKKKRGEKKNAGASFVFCAFLLEPQWFWVCFAPKCPKWEDWKAKMSSSFFWGGEGSPIKFDYRKKLVPAYSNLST